MKTKIYRVIAITLLFFLGFWAIFGGLALITDPTGESLQISLDYLEDSTFEDYLVPGFILLFANGILALVIAISVVRRVENYAFFIMVQGMVLVLWLSIQLYMNSAFYAPYLHISCYVIGILLLIFGALIKVPKERKMEQ